MPPPRPELTSLLLEAIRRRDSATAARLTGQWAHRHGVTSLESFRTGSVVAEAGWEAGDWLLQHMEAAMAPASVTMAEAFAALEDSFAGSPPPTPSSAPAPAPSTLADLRAWLSAAPQHRRAS